MHRHALAGVLLAVAASAGPAQASKDVLDRTADPNQWVIQTGDYANQRYSKLDQINRDTVKNLKVAWTFSTGVLRGARGRAPCGGRRHVRAYALSQYRLRARSEERGQDHLEIRAQAGSLRYSGHVLRYGLPWRRL